MTIMTTLQNAMKIAFASEFAFYLKAHNFHWNVEGSDFKQYHDLFGCIYDEVYSSIDSFAENIRKLDAYAPGSLTRLASLSALTPPQWADDNMSGVNPLDMVQNLLTDSDEMVGIMKNVFDLATELGEDGLANFAAERMDAHQKHSWMLRSTLK